MPDRQAGSVACKTCKSYFLLFQRTKTAWRAISDLRLEESFAARALPPFEAPSLPSATAAGFFFFIGCLRERLGMSHDCCFRKSWKVISTGGFQCITKSLLD